MVCARAAVSGDLLDRTGSRRLEMGSVMTANLPRWDVVEDEPEYGMVLNGGPVAEGDSTHGTRQEQDIRDWLVKMA